LPRLELTVIAQALQGGEPGQRDGCCLLERHTGWL
jgi:hypothetical protein